MLGGHHDVTFPAGFRFSHVAGQSYRHHIELTWFGRGVLQVDEWFLDGHAKLELPFGVVEGPNTHQGANLALWAEAVWFPSIWLTDPRVRWEPVDATSARLIVPFGHENETPTVAFDPATGLLDGMESMRFYDESDAAKVRWMNRADDWDELDGVPVPLRTSVVWADGGTHWARLHTEQIVRNADLDRHSRLGRRQEAVSRWAAAPEASPAGRPRTHGRRALRRPGRGVLRLPRGWRRCRCVRCRR